MTESRLSLTGQRFLRYVRVPSQLDKAALKAGQRPSSPGQRTLAEMLLTDFCSFAEEAGADYTHEFTPGGVLILKILATPGHEHVPHLGLAAHLDTYPNGSPLVEPLVRIYEGGDIILPRSGTVIEAKHLMCHIGRKVITSSGDSVLGADDKAGVAVIMESLYAIIGDHVPHGPITVFFFTDEEEGELNINDFTPEMMSPLAMFLTVDGGKLGVVDTSCYSGRTVQVTFKGVDAHPGEYGELLVPAQLLAAQFMLGLSDLPTPWAKAPNGGYQYAIEVHGEAAEATVICIPRSFDDATSLRYCEQLKERAETTARLNPGSSVDVKVILKYISTGEAIRANPWCVQLLRRAAGESNIAMQEHAVCAGTDGAMMNMHYPRLASPNMGVGAERIHMLTESIDDEDLDAGQRWLTQVIFQATCI